MTGPDPTERMQTQPPAAEPPPPTPPPPAAPTPPPAAPTPPPASPTPSPAAPTPPPASPSWQPPPADHGGAASLILGIIILAIGAWFFATQTLGLDLPDLDWGQLWPVILIVLGGWIVYSSVRRVR